MINYSTIEHVTVLGGLGNDKFISDDTAQAIDLYGNEGNDQFFVGSVLETETVLVEGQEVAVVTQITRGVSFAMNFYGGDNNDYFEVNHNKADIGLYGDNGNDTFFIKALLTLNEDEDLVELDNSTATVSGTSGDGEESQRNNDTREVDLDALVYVENANIKIDGGAGFDSVAIVGTVLSDTFYVFTEVVEGETVQRIFGAGAKLQELLNIERIEIITGGGDDRVYLYGVDLGPVADLVINTGGGSDTVYIGGDELDINLSFPARNVTKYISVDGYEEGGSREIAFGLDIDLTASNTSVIPVNIEEPAVNLSKIVPASRGLSEIKTPVRLVDADNLIDSVVYDARFGLDGDNGLTALVFDDHILTDKQITTDGSRIRYPSTATILGNQTDLVAQLTSLNATNAAAAEQLISEYLQNQIVFTDTYYDLELIDRLLALTGNDTEIVTIDKGISYAVFQQTLNNAGDVVNARFN